MTRRDKSMFAVLDHLLYTLTFALKMKNASENKNESTSAAFKTTNNSLLLYILEAIKE